MASYRKVKNLSHEDAAYIAGLVDGEGTLSLSHRHRNENRQFVISISNTEAQLLNYVCRTVGAGRITRKRINKSNHTPSGTYAIDNRQALDLLEQITPYLKTYKAKRARLVLDHYLRLTPRNGKYSPTQKKARATFVTKFLLMNPRQPTTLRLDALKLPPIGKAEENRPANSINKQKRSPRG